MLIILICEVLHYGNSLNPAIKFSSVLKSFFSGMIVAFTSLCSGPLLADCMRLSIFLSVCVKAWASCLSFVSACWEQILST